MATKLFSLAEADQVLPLVRRIAVDIRGEYRAWKQAMVDFELAIAGVQAGGPEPDHARALREEVERRAVRVQALVEELGELGCEAQGFRSGPGGLLRPPR